ncbi:hypothetical protein YYC_04936 [Plasmodium yoelii 17X]|uniref:Ribosome recycling factor domain-containing protein n=1 Tax=Plasmodium yoelii 17X TaxID=1323249 RepID=V7PCH2_PLAYE|nr:hypothetical protein YYC_04936 [Plasmodium yoelii 17X]
MVYMILKNKKMLQKHVVGFAFFFGIIILSIITGIKCVYLKRQINEHLFETSQNKYPSFFLENKYNIKNKTFFKNHKKIKYHNKRESEKKRNKPYLLYGHKKKNKNNIGNKNNDDKNLEQTLKTKTSTKWNQTNKNEKGKGGEINYDEDDEENEKKTKKAKKAKKIEKAISNDIKEEIKKKNNETLTLKNCSIKKNKLNNLMNQNEENNSTHDQVENGDEDEDEDEDGEENEDENGEEIIITEDEFENLSKLCSEKMNKIYDHIKKESYRFNLNNVSSAMFESERVKINEQIYTINHICHIKKKENLFIITPYDPYFVNFIYIHFTKEYNELKFYIKDKSVYAVIPPLSEHLKNEIKNKIKDKIEESKITLRNLRKKFMNKLEKIKNYIGKDIYFKQKNHIQSLHDQTKKNIEKIFNEAI